VARCTGNGDNWYKNNKRLVESGMREFDLENFNGRNYGGFIVESKLNWKILRKGVSLHHDIKPIHRRAQNPSQASAQ
jgi:hypothetical protein